MNVTRGDIAGHDAEDEGLGEVDAEDGGIVMRVAMHRGGLDFEVVEAGDGHALLEVLDVAVAALSCVAVRLLVNIEVAVVEGAFVRALQLLVLHEVAVELPILRLRRRFAESCLDEAIRGLEILINEEAGGHERLADRVHVLGGLLLRKLRREAERVHATAKQHRERVFILAAGQATHHGAAASALKFAMRGHGALAQSTDHGDALLVVWLVGLLRRHLLRRELIDDVACINESRNGLQRQRNLLKGAITLLHIRIMALQAVFAEKLLHELRRVVRGDGCGERGSESR